MASRCTTLGALVRRAAEGLGISLAIAACTAVPSSTRSVLPETDAPEAERWAAPKDSSFRTPKHYPDPCLGPGGCPFEPAPIPSCARTQRATPNWHDKTGTVVSVPGKLKMVETLSLGDACSFPGCCEARSAWLVLETEFGAIALEAPSRKNAFACGGDTSAICCGFALTNDTIVARGLLRKRRTWLELELIEPSLCQVPKRGTKGPNR